MYLVPALAGKIGGVQVAGLALLVQNIVIFSGVFYFIVPRNRSFGAAVFIIGIFCLFSGWDIAGTGLRYFLSGGLPRYNLIEAWAVLFQYSSQITQLFWVPNHAIPGWVFVCIYLRWLRGEASLGLLLASVALFASWSPLSALGMVPFAAYAGIKSLIERRLKAADIVMFAAAAMAALPMLIYEKLESASVAHSFLWQDPFFSTIYPFFISFEVLPFVALIFFARRKQQALDFTLLVCFIVLLALPFYKIGISDDFAMRSSIPALAILAVLLAVECVESQARVWKTCAFAALAIGSVTGLLEIRRAVVNAPNPVLACNLIQVWQQDIPDTSLAHYIVPLSKVPDWAISVPPSTLAGDPSSACQLPGH